MSARRHSPSQPSHLSTSTTGPSPPPSPSPSNSHENSTSTSPRTSSASDHPHPTHQHNQSQYADFAPTRLPDPSPRSPLSPHGGSGQQGGFAIQQHQYRSGASTPHPLEDARLLPGSPNASATSFSFQQQQQQPQTMSSQEYIDAHRAGAGVGAGGAHIGRNASSGSFAPATTSPLSRQQLPPGTTSSSAPINPFSNANAIVSSATPRSAASSRGSSLRHPPPVSAYGTVADVSADGVITTLGLGSGPHTSAIPPSLGARGSMVLYRLASPPSSYGRGSTYSTLSHHPAVPSATSSTSTPLLMPPRLFSDSYDKRSSVASSSGDSILTLADSKYPSGPGGAGDRALGVGGSVRGLVPYAYDPDEEGVGEDEEDWLHDPEAGLKGGAVGAATGAASASSKGSGEKKVVKPVRLGPDGKPYHAPRSFPWRGVLNVGVLVGLILGLLCLFIFYPVLSFFRDQRRTEAIEGNVRINGTGQAPVLFQMPEPIDQDTPDSAKTRTGFDGHEYELVFSDEFNTDGRSFYPGDDPYWEAVDLWYGATQDLEWYDPQQITTRDGALVITMDSTTTTQANLTAGSTAPFTIDENHGLQYRSGMLQSWNKFCFTTGYIEVAVTFPGPDQSTTGYWPGAWTMGNLGRPGYIGSTDGMWPYTYDSCDTGTFPNQTFADGSGPPDALHSDQSRAKNNFELSWLSGQRVSACTCPGGDHPGPSVTVGRGAPEIDIFETEKDKDIPIVQVVSQSSQFAPFMHDYLYYNDTGDWTNFDPTRTRANGFRGSAVQQSISALTRLPEDMFQGSGAVFRTLGFEYWSDPNDRNAGVITWQVDGQKTHQVTAAAVGPDPLVDIGQRLISEEPMSIVLNLGISQNWQPIDLSTMIFPAELRFDYVRVYQRKDQTNVGCDPKNYPTADYIANHPQAYSDVNATGWMYEKPKNSKYDGC